MTKILLVEDDKSLREIYGVRLLAEGYDIVSAGDGEEALAMAIKERPQLILSDVMMPKISGFDMLDILRSTTETKDVKVIMMTALSSEDQRKRGEQLGADRYLVKSQVGIEDVVRTVHEVLGDVSGIGTQPVASVPQTPPVPEPTPMPQPATRPDIASLSPSPHMTATPQPNLTPTAPQPAPMPQPAAGLPQPVAPFSSTAPRPSGLGDRVIQPLADMERPDAVDVAKLIDQELNPSQPQVSITPESQTVPAAMPAPQEAAIPTPATPEQTPISALPTEPVQPQVVPTLQSIPAQPAAEAVPPLQSIAPQPAAPVAEQPMSPISDQPSAPQVTEPIQTPPQS